MDSTKKNIICIIPLLICLIACNNQSHDNTLQDFKSEEPVNLTFDNVRFYFSVDNCSEKSDNCSYFLLEYPTTDPEKYQNAAILNDQIKSEVMDLLKPVATNISENSFEEIAHGFLDRYRQFKKDFPESHQRWHLKMTANEIWQSQNLVTIKFNYQDFTGGAHPNYACFFKIYAKQDGLEMPLEDLVTDTGKIRQLAEKKFRELKNIPVDKALNNSSYNFSNNKFMLNNNFGMDSTGLFFLYNPYEIAAYSEGTTKIHLSFDELRGLLKSGVQ